MIKKMMIFYFVFNFISCSNNYNSTIKFLYHDFDNNNYSRYHLKIIQIRKDTVFLVTKNLDNNFQKADSSLTIYIKDSLNLYRMDAEGNERLFFTLKNHDNVLFNVKYIMQDEDWEQLTEIELNNYIEEPLPTFLGYNHRYVKDTTITDMRGKLLPLHKFFISCNFYRDRRDSITEFYDNDYYFYYTNDFILYKTEYLGNPLGWHIETTRLGTVEEVFGNK